MSLLLAPVLAGAIYTTTFLCAWVQFDQRAVLNEDGRAEELAYWCRASLPEGLKVTAIAGVLYVLSMAL